MDHATEELYSSLRGTPELPNHHSPQPSKMDHRNNKSSSNSDSHVDMFPPSPKTSRLPPVTEAAENLLTISIEPVALITTECITITSAMRKHSRWAQSSVSAILGGSTGKPQEMDSYNQTLKSNDLSSRQRGPRIPDPSKVDLSGSGEQSLASRLGLRNRKGKEVKDNPLLSAFARLRRDLAGCRDISTVDAPSLLHPFLQVIRSSSTSAAITSLAVISITKFLSYNIITERSPRIELAMMWLSAAITHCRFEASDSAADEIVLLRILKLMETIITRPEGQLLGDESICEMMSTGLSMCCQARLSEVLRRSAEIAMVTMCQVIFNRLKTLEVEQPLPFRSRSNTLRTEAGDDEVKMAPSLNGDLSRQGGQALRLPPNASEAPSGRPSMDLASEADRVTATAQTNGNVTEEVKPYAVPSIKELFRVLIDLLDPHDKSHTDPMRIMALRIIDVALEISGPAIAQQPAFAQLVEDDLCRHLFQLVRSDNMVLLNSSLRVAGTLLMTCRSILKLQQELFLSYLVACLHPKVDIPREPGIDPTLYEGVPQAPKLVKPQPSQPNSGRSTPVPVKDRQKLGLEGGHRRPEAREAMVESIGNLVRIPSFMAELFVNYDCDVDRQDLCEDMVGLLSRNAFPDSATWSTTNVPPLCLDSLLTFVQFLAERCEGDPVRNQEDAVQELRKRRLRKKVIKAGAAKFNDKPKAGIAFLVSNGIINDPDDPVQIAKFLKGTTHISKKVLGDFLSKKGNDAILTSFIDLFQFDDKRIDEALRDFLGSFRLPGESALIERIITVFSEKYCASSVPPGIADKDAAFVLTYAILMLNTDLYNPNVKTHLDYESFVKNLRGLNAKENFDPEYLRGIFDAIKDDEIILPDEHDNKHAFEYAWKELLVKTREIRHVDSCDTNVFDAEMFQATWKPIVATLCYVFMSASEDAVYSRVVVGFDQLAQIAANYGNVEAFDRIVYSLASISTLASETPSGTSLNTEVSVGKKTIMVSETAVKFGRDFRAQLATVVLFRVLAGHEDVLRESWPYVLRIVRNLFVNSLITLSPTTQSRMTELPPIPLQPPSQIIDKDGKMAETGLFSSFTSYLSSYAADDPPEPSEEELENTLSTVDCMKVCQPQAVLAASYNLPAPQVKLLVQGLLAMLPDESSPLVTVKTDRPPTATGRPSKNGTVYNASTVFLLEMATALTLRDEDTIAAAGEMLTASLQTSIRDAANLHPLAASRMVLYLLDSLRLAFEYDFIRAPVVLHAISSFDDTVLDHTAEAVLQGLTDCIAKPGPLRNEIVNSPDFWSILQRLHQHKTEADHVFEILQNIASSQPTVVTADNYESAIALANDFASAGSIGTIQEQRRDLMARRGKQVKPLKAEENGVVIRGSKAINIIYMLTSRILSLIEQSHLERHEAWAAYWSPIFRALSAQCVNPCREIRHKAMTALQRSLLSENLASDDHTEWIAIFGEVLFPLIGRLLKPEIFQLDQVGMVDTRTQAATSLCKIFLRYLDHLGSNGQMLEVWLQILGILDRMMNSGSGDALAEAVPESLKNILLVMAGGGYLTPPGKGEKGDQMWEETRTRLDKFQPDLLQSLFPPKTPAPVVDVEEKKDLVQEVPVKEEKVEEATA
jgi:golgi-specific brefeldin A-resistance guanine nucleotide exchange factor 1